MTAVYLTLAKGIESEQLYTQTLCAYTQDLTLYIHIQLQSRDTIISTILLLLTTIFSTSYIFAPVSPLQSGCTCLRDLSLKSSIRRSIYALNLLDDVSCTYESPIVHSR